MNDNESDYFPFAKRFHSHEIHISVDAWIDRLNDERPMNLEEFEDEYRDAYFRLKWVLKDLKERLETLNPGLACIKTLDDLQSTIRNLDNSWNQYKGSPQSAWTQLENISDALLINAAPIPHESSGKVSQDIMYELSHDMMSVIKKAKKELSVIQDSVKEYEHENENALQRLEEFRNEITAQKTRLDEILNQHTTTFNQSELDRSKTFSKSQDEHNYIFNSNMDEFESISSATVSKHENNMGEIEEKTQLLSEEVSGKLEAKLVQAEKVVGTIVKTTMSGTYKEIATREYQNAWYMRLAALFSFFAMGLMLIWALLALDFSKNGIEWNTIMFRISLGFPFLIPGIYCASESARHWKAEKNNRRLALEMATLKPFIVDLDEEKKKEFIERKADEYFGSNDIPNHDDETDLKGISLSGDQIKALKEIVSIIPITK